MEQATQTLVEAALRWAETAVSDLTERQQLEDDLADAALAYRAAQEGRAA